MSPQKSKIIPGLAKRLQQVIGEGHGGQKSFAREAGISETSLSEYLSNKTSPDATTLSKMHQNCGVDINWLLTGQSSIPSTQPKPSARYLPKELSSYMDKAEYILTMGSVTYVAALKENLTAFARAVEQEKKDTERDEIMASALAEISSLKKKVGDLEEERDTFKSQLSTYLKLNDSEDCGAEVGLPSTSGNEKAT